MGAEKQERKRKQYAEEAEEKEENGRQRFPKGQMSDLRFLVTYK